MINKLNILVIDDDQDIGRMLKMLLEFKGFSVTIAENKTMAVETLNNTPMDIIIMDMLLSGENGICLLYTSPSPRDRTRYRMPSSA